MNTTLLWLVGLAFLAFVGYGWFIAWQDRNKPKIPDAPLEVNAQTIGLVTGLLGGDIADAAVVRYALERFEQEKGRKATVRDLGMVAAMVQRVR